MAQSKEALQEETQNEELKDQAPYTLEDDARSEVLTTL